MGFDKANIWSHVPCFPESRILAALLVPAGKNSQGAAARYVPSESSSHCYSSLLCLDLSSHARDYKEMM